MYPARRWCDVCGTERGTTPRGNCADCEALAEVYGRPRPRRKIPRKPARAPAAKQTAPADVRVLASLSPVLRKVYELLYLRRMGVRAAARELGVSAPSIVTARKRIQAKLDGAEKPALTLDRPPGQFRKSQTMKHTKLPLKVGHGQVFIDPRCHDGDIYAPHTPTIVLDPSQAVMLARLAEALQQGGVAISQQGDAVGWLLDRLREQMMLDRVVAAEAFAGPQPCPVCDETIDQVAFDRKGADGVYKITGPVITYAHARHFLNSLPADERKANWDKVEAVRAAQETKLTIGAA